MNEIRELTKEQKKQIRSLSFRSGLKGAWVGFKYVSLYSVGIIIAEIVNVKFVNNSAFVLVASIGTWISIFPHLRAENQKNYDSIIAERQKILES